MFGLSKKAHTKCKKFRWNYNKNLYKQKL